MRAFQISALIETAIRDERERIIAMNAPEIERINAYIKALEDAARQALEAIERGESFDYLDNEVAVVLRAALAEPVSKAQE